MLTQTLNSFPLVAPGMAQAMSVPSRSLGAPLWDTAGALPSLDLNLAQNKSLLDSVTGQSLVTFTRASSGTYTDSAGVLQTAATNVPRFDHNPQTGESLGLLVEEARTNLVQQSADISNVYWVKAETTVTANAIAAPDGTTTAGKLIESTANSQHTLASAAITWAGNTQYTVTFYAKAAERFNFDILFGTGGNWVNAERVATFNVSTGTIVSPPASPASASIQAVGNGWYRCRLTTTTVASPSASAVFIRMADSTPIASYQGIAGYGIYLWGAQLEAGSFPTSYIPTTTATVTRAADVASITGSNFSSWYRQDQSTVYCQGLIPPGLSAFPTFHMASDGSVNNQWSQYAHTSGLYANLRTGNVGQGDPGVTGSPVVGAAYRLATGFTENNVCTVWNGTVGTPDTSASMPTALNEFRIGANRTGGTVINTTISRLTYWPTRLANTTLQQITL